MPMILGIDLGSSKIAISSRRKFYSRRYLAYLRKEYDPSADSTIVNCIAEYTRGIQVPHNTGCWTVRERPGGMPADLLVCDLKQYLSFTDWPETESTIIYDVFGNNATVVSPPEAAAQIIAGFWIHATQAGVIKPHTNPDMLVCCTPAFMESQEELYIRKENLARAFESILGYSRDQIRVVDEPTAVTLSLRKKYRKLAGLALIIDIGAYTIDLAVVNLDNARFGGISLLKTYSISNLAGRWLDVNLLAECFNAARGTRLIQLQDNYSYRVLTDQLEVFGIDPTDTLSALAEIEQKKIQYSNNPKNQLELEWIHVGPSLTKQQIQEIFNATYTEWWNTVKTDIQIRLDAFQLASNITTVLLVGGGSRWSTLKECIQSDLAEYLAPNVKVLRSNAPELAVSRGAVQIAPLEFRKRLQRRLPFRQSLALEMTLAIFNMGNEQVMPPRVWRSDNSGQLPTKVNFEAVIEDPSDEYHRRGDYYAYLQIKHSGILVRKLCFHCQVPIVELYPTDNDAERIDLSGTVAYRAEDGTIAMTGNILVPAQRLRHSRTKFVFDGYFGIDGLFRLNKKSVIKELVTNLGKKAYPGSITECEDTAIL